MKRWSCGHAYTGGGGGGSQGDLFPELPSKKRDPIAGTNGAYDSDPVPPNVRELGRHGRIRVGTSGYSFADWVGPLYSDGTPRNRMLDEYVRHFDVVEINSSYYRVPDERMFERMERKTPPGFEFIVKLYRGMTHEIEDDASMYAAFTDAVVPLRDAGKFGGYLAQFPWKFKNTVEAQDHLRALRERLGDDPLFVEFRHDSWITPSAFDLLRASGLGYCSVDEPSLKGLLPPIAQATTDTGYVRFHGRNAANWWGRGGGDRYDYDYSAEELSEWSQKLLTLEERVKKVYAFFNNCHAGHAARNAELMIEMLGDELGERR
ncbi:MAG: DUF72 domain-containing protein [Candidatus Eisenbacteria bacterium]